MNGKNCATIPRAMANISIRLKKRYKFFFCNCVSNPTVWYKKKLLINAEISPAIFKNGLKKAHGASDRESPISIAYIKKYFPVR